MRADGHVPSDELERAGRVCLSAVHAASACAVRCATDPELDPDGTCTDACIVAARVIGAFADVVSMSASRCLLRVGAALARAALEAAEVCASALAGLDNGSCAEASAACERAGGELRRVLPAFECAHRANGAARDRTVASALGTRPLTAAAPAAPRA